MLSESQNIEYKESWRDEYLKWICGFANAHGGHIYIGVNDNKEVIGLPDAKKLMEDIPNKIVNYLGIVEDVNLLAEGDKEYIEIDVAPSNMPIAYKVPLPQRLNQAGAERTCLATVRNEEDGTVMG